MITENSDNEVEERLQGVSMESRQSMALGAQQRTNMEEKEDVNAVQKEDKSSKVEEFFADYKSKPEEVKVEDP